MCDIITTICSVCYEPVWNFLKEESAYICKFEDNHEDLKESLDDLKAKRDDVLSKVNDEERKGMRRRAVVARWLSRVETIETETDLLLADASPLAERLSSQCFCNIQNVSAYSCGKKMSRQLNEVEKLSSEGVFDEGIEITHSAAPEYWTWSSIHEPPNEVSFEVATLIEVYWLDIRGTYHTRKLTPQTKYEVVFVVKLEQTASGWEEPVNLSLELVVGGKSEFLQETTLSLEDYISDDEWVDIKVGDFVAPPVNASAKILFKMYQYDDTLRKTGLVVKGVAIRAVNQDS